MKLIFTLLALTGTTLAHNVVTHFHINGDSTMDCVRQASSADPITDLQSSTMACNNIKGLAPKKCTIKPGDAIGFEWRADPGIPPAQYPLKDGTIPVGVTDDSHKGPCSIYMKKVTDAANADGVGDGWFKVSEDGLKDGVFCSDRLRLANAPQPGVVPANVEPGDYLLRAEIITLNNAGPASLGGAEQPQFYVSCVQVTVEGSSGTNPGTVSIPGYVTLGPPASPGLIYDIWNSPDGKFSDYTVPGPAPMSTGPGTPVSSSKQTTAPTAQPTSTAPTSGSGSETPATSAPAPTYGPETPTTPTYDQPTSNNVPTPAPTTDSDSGETPVPTYDPDTPATSPTISSNRPTRTPNCTVTTATTLVTSTSTVSPGETGTSDDETPASSSEPTYTHTRHGWHHRGRNNRRVYHAAS